MAAVKQIVSAENPQFKLLKKLAASSRERRKSGQTLLDGVHLLHALAAHSGRPRQLVLREDVIAAAEIRQCLALFPEVPVISLPAALFAHISPVEHATGIVALLDIPQAPTPASGPAVLLENIQDPGNLGSILRSTAAAGVPLAYLSAGCAEAWSPKALRAGMGAQFVVAIVEGQGLPEVAARFPSVIATTLHGGQSLYATDLRGEVAFLFGNEGAGLSAALLQHANYRITIPMPGRIESLNVAAAAAICLFERVRQLQA